MTDSIDPRAPLDPAIAVLFDTLRETRPPGRPLDIDALRDEAEMHAPFMCLGAPDTAWEDEVTIPSEGGGLRARVWGARPRTEHAPVIVYAHGGGFVMMSPETHAGLTRRLCVAANATVVSLAYRLAPEHKYPAALHDCRDAVRWVRAHAHELGGDPERIAIAGDSAGGNLAMATPLLMRAEGERGPDAVISLCGAARLAMDSESYLKFGPDDPLLNSRDMLYFRDNYIPRSRWTEPYASPAGGDLSQYPPACIVVGGIDPLHDDGILMAHKLQDAGRTVQLLDYAGMPHVWMILPGVEQGDHAIEAVGAFVKRVFGG